MICNKCGAPIPPGMDTCPYCGWKCEAGAAPRDTGFDDETSFVGPGGAASLNSAPEETVFAGGGMAAPLAGPEETQFAPGGAFPASARTGGQPASPAPAPARPAQPARPRPAQKQSLWKNPVLRAALLVVLAVLIVVLILR